MPGDKDELEQRRTTKELTSELTEAQLEDIRNAFNCFDIDGGGTIDNDEFARLVATMGHHSEDEVKRLVAEIDTDGNNEIDFDEFLSFVLHHLPGKPDPVKEASDAFGVFDHYGNGSLDAGEIQLAMLILGKNISIEDAEAMVEAADTDEDGELTLEDFLRKISEK